MRIKLLPELDKITGVYVIKNSIDNRIYVGSAQNIKVRWQHHVRLLIRGIHRNTGMQGVVSEHGIEVLSIQILEACALSDLKDREQHYIDSLESFAKGFNLIPYSRGAKGMPRSEETKRKISLANKGRKMTPEQVAKGFGPNRKPYVRNEALIEQRASKIRGRKRSPETIEKVRQGNLGKIISPEQRARLREVNLGKKLSEETKKKILVKKLEKGKLINIFDLNQNHIGQIKSVLECAKFVWGNYLNKPVNSETVFQKRKNIEFKNLYNRIICALKREDGKTGDGLIFKENRN